MILIAYDGSDDADAAIREAGTLMPGHPAVVLTVAEAGAPRSAHELARAGAVLAHEAGVDARPRARPALDGVAQTILNQAELLDSRAIVLGRSGLSGTGARPDDAEPLGSVTRALVRRARCALLVVSAAGAGAEPAGMALKAASER